MNDRLLIDSNVLIDFLRHRSEAVAFMAGLIDQPFTSAIVVAELYAGVRDGAERLQLDELVNGLRVVPLSRTMAIQAGLHVRKYGKSHSVGIADALIAATAEVLSMTFVTLNVKHFPMLTNILVPYTKP